MRGLPGKPFPFKKNYDDGSDDDDDDDYYQDVKIGTSSRVELEVYWPNYRELLDLRRSKQTKAVGKRLVQSWPG